MASKYKIPRMPGGHPVPFSRGDFLGGKTKVYFGPGQPPCAWPGFGDALFDSDEFDPNIGQSDSEEDNPSDRPYIPPTSWPSAGSILRVPQVVHLSLDLSLFAGNWLGTDDPRAHGWTGDPFNIYNAEWARVTTLLLEAKAKIETIRPERTWVQVNQMKRSFIRPFDGAHLTYEDFRRDARVIELLAPPEDADAYFGSDFLHVYLGSHARDISQGDFIARGDHWVEDFDGSAAAIEVRDGIVETEMSSEEYASSRAAIVKAKDTFAGHRTMLYDSSGLSQPVPGRSDQQFYWWDGSVLPDVPPPPRESSTLVFPWFESRQFMIDEVVTVAVFDRIADDLEDYGVTHDGAMSEITSSDQIVGIVAAHFGFDPETGADILG